MSGSKTKAPVIRLLRPLLGLMALVFVVAVGWDLFRKFEPGRISIDARWVVLSLPCAGGAMLCQLAAWRSLIERFSGRKVPLLPAAVLYLDSQMARYTPGKLGLVAVRVAGAGELGVPARVLASTLFIELASWTAVGLLLGTGTLAAFATCQPTALPVDVGTTLGSLVQVGAWALAAGALLGTVVLCSVRRERLPEALIRLLLGPLATEGLGRIPLAPVTLPLWHFAHWIAWVVAGACLGLSVHAGLAEALVVGASLCVAIVLGFLAIVAPAGAGVREAVLAALAAPSLGPAAALSLGLMARGVALLSEVLLWLSARGLRLSRRQ